jgi:hypothetical protein
MKRGKMIINITCPNCNFSKDVPSEKIPEGIKHAKCPRCSKTFEIPVIPEDEPLSMERLAEVPVQQETPPPLPGKITDVKAEPVDEHASPVQEDYGYFTGLYRVLSGVLFSPTEFFRGARGMALKDALIFGILTGSIGYLFNIFWKFYFQSPELSLMTKLFPDMASNDIILGMMIWSPFIVFMSTLFTAAVFHISLFILGAASRGFEGTFKVILFSNAISVFNLIPYSSIAEVSGFISYIGFIALTLWSIIIIVTGLKEIHEISTVKAVLSLILPLFIIMILLGAFSVIFFAGKLA